MIFFRTKLYFKKIDFKILSTIALVALFENVITD